MIIDRFLVNIPDNLVPVVILLDHYYLPVCVPIYAQVISYTQVPRRHWDIYDNI